MTARRQHGLAAEGLRWRLVLTFFPGAHDSIDRKRELILGRELAFANAWSGAVREAKVSFWMVLLPILFVYFMYRMQDSGTAASS